MSVKSKVKRCNQEIKRLEAKIFELENEKYKLTRIEKDYKKQKEKLELYENIIKFALTNQIGGLVGGMIIDGYGLDKMKNLSLKVERDPCARGGYILKVHY